MLAATRYRGNTVCILIDVATTPLDTQFLIEVGVRNHDTSFNHDLADRNIDPLNQRLNFCQLGSGISDNNCVGALINYYRTSIGNQRASLFRAGLEELHHIGCFGITNAQELRAQGCKLGNLLVRFNFLSLPLSDLIRGGNHQHVANLTAIEPFGF